MNAHTRRSSRKTSGAIVVAALLSAPAAHQLFAQASTPVVPTTLEACYVPLSGTLYRIDPPASPAANAPKGCLASTHVKCLWNQQGMNGEQGAPGPAGANGTLAKTSWGALDLGGLDGFASVWRRDQLAHRVLRHRIDRARFRRHRLGRLRDGSGRKRARHRESRERNR